MQKKTAFPFPFPLPANAIAGGRAQILAHLTTIDDAFSRVPVMGIQPSTLEAMLESYDALFLSGYLKSKKYTIDVTLSSRLTSSAGKFVSLRGAFGRIKHMEIRMISDYLLRLHEGPFHLNGLEAQTPQEAFLMVFEHELCHAMETLLYGHTGHSSRFMAIANGLFGHTATRHRLPTRKQDAARSGFFIGSRVAFSYKGTELTGIITYIGKTVTVMVPCRQGAYKDKQGIRYEKFRISPERLIEKNAKAAP